MDLAPAIAKLTLQPGGVQIITLGLVNMSEGHSNYDVRTSSAWPTQLSTTRVNALGSGEVAFLTLTVVAPSGSAGQTARIDVVAKDLLGSMSLSREATIHLQAVDNTPGKIPGGRPPRIE